MKEIKRRESELLVKVCKKNDVPRKLIYSLIDTAKEELYENNTQSQRIKKYQNLIDFHYNK
jgi:hypothetical protein